ncbi:MAG TPA: AAA family ATPase, partial [Chitinophagales bacterium]|nr:AAA family ATPase [Chitinophagales bacterium]
MLASLRLQHFRSYTDDSFEFDDGVNIIVGPNASGKTNLLEAVLVIARGSSYRVKDSELVQFKKPWSRLDSRLVSGAERTVKIQQEPQASKSYKFDGKEYKRLPFNHTVPVVLFEPNHLLLLSGGPERRRDYLDDLLEQTVVGYTQLRRQYRRTLAQRNALLKQPGQIELFPWDVRLSQLAGQIVRHRSELVTTIQKRLPKLYRELSKTKLVVSVEYGSEWPPANYESGL